MSINVLPEDVIKRIAAGEVIERPVSVVKELIENSLDANARRIEVRIEDGGITGITIIDNGSGIARDDIHKLLKRHSTSKIHSEDDLNAISTLGFRGEALYSIASVTKLRIRTRARGENEGTELISEDGAITVNSISAPVGTTVEATSLFYNTPARKKFLKSPGSEYARIADVVSRYVLAYPSISFELSHNGRSVLHSIGGGPEDPLIALWGVRTASEMLPVDYRSAIASISGFISSPTISRSSRKDITIFVNGRLVKDSAIQLATEKAFENVLKPGRFPIAILKIAVPPDNVDVNVHPNKREVRFVDSQAIFRAVQAACEKTLRMHSPLTRPQTMPLPDETSFEKPAHVQQNAITTELPAEVIFQDDEFQKTPTTLFRSHPAQSLLRHGEVIEYLNTYLVFEDSGELTVVDFHNLHERILFEEMEDAERSETGGVPSQKLMFPESFTLPPDLAQILEENFDFINRMGFEVEPFGSGAFILRAVPHFIKHDSVAEALIDILRETLDESSGSPVLMDFRRRFKISTACKSAIKAGKRLKPEEMEFLLRHATDARYMNCPHGRPTIIKLDRSFFDSRFKRRSNV